LITSSDPHYYQSEFTLSPKADKIAFSVNKRGTEIGTDSQEAIFIGDTTSWQPLRKIDRGYAMQFSADSNFVYLETSFTHSVITNIKTGKTESISWTTIRDRYTRGRLVKSQFKVCCGSGKF
jgi:hypothetical protein